MLRLTIVNEEKQNLASIKKDIVKSKNQLKVFPTRFRFLAISVNMGKSSPLREKQNFFKNNTRNVFWPGKVSQKGG